ncbi:MAG TPA: phosphate ABC transporter substrate-binding protein PstS [Marmoricola sp.]|nr:phosphate ABC transporter substrate-binding protein PstS [Marmoricola sp.]
MNVTSLRRAAVPAAALALSLSLAACGSSSGGAGLSGSVTGGGSSAQKQAQGAWTSGFNATSPNAKITYNSVGSGTGKSNFTSGAYLFAGSDSAMNATTLAAAKQQCGADPLEFPVFISPIDVVYNLPGVSNLQLSPITIAKIFAGKIAAWNDNAIKADNPGVTLPSTKITVVHRSDGSGTTNNFTDYLNKAAPSVWTTAADDNWPTTNGANGAGTSGVVTTTEGTTGAIAYADDSGVHGSSLSVAKIKVGNTYVAPSASGAANDLASSTLVSGLPASVMQYSLDRTTTDPSSYPIFMASYEIACPSYKDSNTAAIVKGYLNYIISVDGQKAAAANAYSAPLPRAIATKEQALVNKIS